MRYHRVMDSNEMKEKNRYFEDLKAGIIRAFVLAFLPLPNCLYYLIYGKW
ncbi:MAG: hypothetical protein XE04_0719 [Marinimicrobia bacterium 46_43]|nr:MAG: hypothetical protein XE04_0719 [Marinimicrobia bacterium 46_43]